MEDEAAATLVLVSDREFELRASVSRVRFSAWASQPPSALLAGFALSLVPRDVGGDDPQPQLAELPVILTPPATTRFRLSRAAGDGSGDAGPLMPLLRPGRPVRFEVAFIPPSAAESDYAWDDFRDQIAVHARLGRLVVALSAAKRGRPGDAGPEHAFHPPALPAVRAPPLRLFDLVARGSAASASPAAPAAAARVSESFNGAKRTPAQALEPLPSAVGRGHRVRAASQARAEVAQAAGTEDGRAATEVGSLKEARAVVAQLRVQRAAAHRGAGGRTTGAAHETNEVGDGDGDGDSPEAVTLAARRELDAFRGAIAAAKQRVADEAAAARRELCFYEQFLPAGTAPPDVKEPLGPSASQPVAALVAGRGGRSSAAKARARGRLPRLGADGTASNQEPSPRAARASGAADERKRAARVRPGAPQRQRAEARDRDESDGRSDGGDADPALDAAPEPPEEITGVAALERDADVDADALY